MLMLPTPIPAEEALSIGLVDALAEPGAALDAALQDASRLAAGPAQALGAIFARQSAIAVALIEKNMRGGLSGKNFIPPIVARVTLPENDVGDNFV